MIFPVVLIYIICAVLPSKAKESYKAAVVEYSPVNNPFDVGSAIVKSNLKHYVDIIDEAISKGVDIVVFPEYGLTTLEASNLMPEHLMVYSVPLSNISTVHCDNNTHEVLRSLACAAAKGIYVVVNLIEREERASNTSCDYFNTNVVFNNRGDIIAKYRKMNLYYESSLLPGKQVVTFKTDFGVTFGMFICFDILFKNPAVDVLKDSAVTDVIYSTAWISETPHLSALSVQAAYARGHGVNFLASGYNRPSSRSGGSGIYLADGTIAEAYISGNAGTKLLIQDVPKIRQQTPPKICPGAVVPKPGSVISETPEKFAVWRENLTNYTLEPLNNNSLITAKRVCSGDFCCNFNIILKNLDRNESNYYYRMAVYYGVRHLGVVKTGIRTCGVVACSASDSASCGERVTSLQPISFKLIQISVEINDTDDSNIFDMPSTLRADLGVIDNYAYCKQIENGRISMTLNEEHNLFTFGFYGRMYNIKLHDKLDAQTWLNIFMGLTAILIVLSLAFIYYAQRTHLKFKIS